MPDGTCIRDYVHVANLCAAHLLAMNHLSDGKASAMVNTRNNGNSGSGVILSHSGKQHAYQTASALQATGALRLFLTGSYYKRDLYPDRLARFIPRFDTWLQKRFQQGLDSRKIRRFPTLELPEVAYRLLRGNDQFAARLVDWRDKRFDRAVSELLPEASAGAFWGFQGSCSLSLRTARKLGMKTILEYATIPDEVSRTLLDQDLSPQAARLRSRASSHEHGEAAVNSAQERMGADIFVTASSFSARALAAVGVHIDRIRVIPLGVDPRRFTYQPRDAKGPLRVLFVGKLAWHKGIHYLLEAMQILRNDNITLSLVGPSVGDESLTEPWGGLFRTLGSLEGDALVGAFHEHDVLVVPSLYEGFGFVIVEAMASGMPVIATENSCAPDVIRAGIDGFIIPARNSEAIAERLEWLATNRAQLIEMGHNAATRALDFSWERYRERVRDFIFDMSAKTPTN